MRAASRVREFLGIPYETATLLWRKQLERYLDTKDADALREVEDKVKIISYTRIMQHYIRRNGLNTEEGRRHIASSRAVLEELLPHVDSLVF